MKNNFLIYFVFIFFIGTSILCAQEYAGGGTPQQWSMTFDTIKSKVNVLLERNNQLSADYRSLVESQQKTVQSIEEQGTKNLSMQQFIKERHGKTDQQVRQEELEGQLKVKKVQLAIRQGQALELKDQLTRLNRLLELKKTKIADLELRQNMPAASAQTADVISASGDAELDNLRKELEEQKAEEVHLEEQLCSMTQETKHPEMALLREKLASLQRQKEELLKGAPVIEGHKGSSDIDRKMYFAAIEQKAKLESRIHQFENKMNSLKSSSGFSVTWTKEKKKLIHEVVQMDARNSQLRGKINNLREDIALLKEGVNNLQKKVKK
mgnify:CR=1 FL=1